MTEVSLGRSRCGRRVAGWLLAVAVLLGGVACVELEAWWDPQPAPAATGDVSAADRPSGVPADAEPAVLDRVVDGDTIRVEGTADGPLGEDGSVRVRLLNIDAPELERDGQAEECLAVEATVRVEELLAPGDLVWLAADVRDRDRFGRPLRGVWTADGTFVNEVLAAEGLAEPLVVGPNDRFHAVVVAAADVAAAQRLGIHGPACR